MQDIQSQAFNYIYSVPGLALVFVVIVMIFWLNDRNYKQTRQIINDTTQSNRDIATLVAETVADRITDSFTERISKIQASQDAHLHEIISLINKNNRNTYETIRSNNSR